MAAKNRTVLTKEKETQGFSRVTDPLELHRLLSRAIETRAKADVRLSDRKKFQATILETSDIKSGFHFEAAPELTDEDLKAPVEGAMIIAFLRGQMLLCIHSEKAQWKDRILTVSLPWAVFKLQRRKEPRFEIPSAYELFVEVDAVEGTKRRLQKRVIDVSEHGMGFQLASQREAAAYKKGLFLRRMYVVIENRQIFFDGRVSSILPIVNNPHYSGVKIGIEIIRISPADLSFLASYIARNLVQIYS